MSAPGSEPPVTQAHDSPDGAAPPSAVPPERLGDFRILRVIGRGGMGVVYEAEQVSLGRRVALKILPQALRLDPTRKARFEREARAAAKLHHTNIVPVFGVGEHGGVPYYVMQLIDGQGLDAVLAELRRPPAPDVLATAAESQPRDEGPAAEVARSLAMGESVAAPPADPGSTLAAPSPANAGSPPAPM